jgi:hypothetical protein
MLPMARRRSPILSRPFELGYRRRGRHPVRAAGADGLLAEPFVAACGYVAWLASEADMHCCPGMQGHDADVVLGDAAEDALFTGVKPGCPVEPRMVTSAM